MAALFVDMVTAAPKCKILIEPISVGDYFGWQKSLDWSFSFRTHMYLIRYPRIKAIYLGPSQLQKLSSLQPFPERKHTAVHGSELKTPRDKNKQCTLNLDCRGFWMQYWLYSLGISRVFSYPATTLKSHLSLSQNLQAKPEEKMSLPINEYCTNKHFVNLHIPFIIYPIILGYINKKEYNKVHCINISS